jgi:hypothetical protein
MKPLGHLFALAALELAGAAEPARASVATSPDNLSAEVSREDIAAAWRRWAEADRIPARPGRRGLALPAPRPTV